MRNPKGTFRAWYFAPHCYPKMVNCSLGYFNIIGYADE